MCPLDREASIRASIDKEREKAFALNEYIFLHPEMPHKEFLACKRYVELLKKEGIPVEENFLGVETSFKATIHEDSSSPIKIGILAEYDALPEIGHACGHSASGALSFLAALGLYRHQDELKGNIYLIGTPGEEFGGVKTDFAKSGYFDDFSFVIMIHMYDKNQPYSKFTALAGFDYKFSGHPAHAAACPWDGQNAVNGMTLFIHALDMMRQQLRDGTRVHGIITKGGSATNVIPDFASCQYLFRYSEKAYLDKVVQMALDAAEGCAKATQTTLEITAPAQALADLKATPQTNELIASIYEELGVEIDPSPVVPLGSSDIGNLSYRCPAFHPMISVTNEPLAIHTKEFAACMKTDKAKWAIEKGAKTIATLILRAMSDETIIQKMKEDFAK